MRYPKPGGLYLSSAAEYDKYKLNLKLKKCPHCGQVGFLNAHGFLWGKTADGSQTLRGWRVFCSNRGRRGGCGRTFSIHRSNVLRRRSFRAPQLREFLKALFRGQSRHAAGVAGWLEPLRPRSVYPIWQALQRNLPRLRSLLCRRSPPPDSRQSDPILGPVAQISKHLSCAFPKAACPISAFQAHFQEPFLI
ncbi:MAG: hypothetical protein DRP85_08385 [Candidatus Makaraimicrobium thalassicum]|nr:MAG: hypothetical protein DRP85_08385 [Candidatus Omnitrophota bacterium]